MGQGRRDFLRLITLAPPVATAAAKAVASVGGPINTTTNKMDHPPTLGPYDEMYQTLNASMVNVVDHGLYDVMRVPAGVEVPKWFPFFYNPVGYNPPGSWDVKTHADTNMVTWCCLPPPRAQRVDRILAIVNPDADPEDISKLFMSYYFEFIVLDKVVARAPIATCPTFGDITQLFNTAPGEKDCGRRLKAAVPENMGTHLKIPVMLESQMHFKLDIHGMPFATKRHLEMFWVLDGLGVFEVQ